MFCFCCFFDVMVFIYDCFIYYEEIGIKVNDGVINYGLLNFIFLCNYDIDK